MRAENQKINAFPTAIITGVYGQDGFYLANFLSKRGYRVIGLVRDGTRRHEHHRPNAEIISCNLLDGLSFREVLEKYAPREVYNLAARASSSQLSTEVELTAEINGLAVVRMLEAVKTVGRSIRFCQASSSEMFGMATESPQNEVTPFRPRNPYGVAKLMAHGMTGMYRTYFNTFACSAILFNHESPRRGHEFVTRKVTAAVARIKAGLSDLLELGSLDARRDWGYAPDYVDAMWRMLQAPKPDDYVVATGVSHSVRDLCKIAFDYAGLDYQKFVKADVIPAHSLDRFPLVGDASKAKSVLGWQPTVPFVEFVHQMVDADMANLEQRPIKP